jgi:hypothetical protein
VNESSFEEAGSSRVDNIESTQDRLRPRLSKVCNWEAIHQDLWLRWRLVLQR